MAQCSRASSRALLCAIAASAVAAGAAGTAAEATTCSTVAACVLGTNTGSGYGVEGTSVAGNGVFGLTTFLASSTSNAKAGVLGTDGTAKSTNRYNFGILGTATYGIGTGGHSTYGTGVSGTSGPGHGVEGDSTTGMGVVGITLQQSTGATDAKAGVAGFDNSTKGTFDSGVFGSSARGLGVYGTSASGIGVNAFSHTGTAFNASVDQRGNAITASAACTSYHCVSGYAGYFKANGASVYVEGYSPYPFDSIPSLYAYQSVQAAPTIAIAANSEQAISASGTDYGVVSQGTASGTGTAYFAGSSSSYLFRGGGDLFNITQPDTVSIDVKGNMILAGTLTAGGTPYVVVRSSDGTRNMTYGSRNTQPSIEDFGEARLTAGRAFVPIDAALGKSIDASRGYLVFLTPQGETSGLYVSQKSSGGFTVREAGTPHSNVAFDYRIVARAYGESSAARLPQYAAVTHSFKRPIFVTGPRTLDKPFLQVKAGTQGGRAR